MISSHVKITCYLHMWKYHLCYSYIINRAFQTKKLLKCNGLVFHWCSCWKNISLVRCAHSWNIFQHSKRNFLSPRGYVISLLYLSPTLSLSLSPSFYIYIYIYFNFLLPKKKGTALHSNLFNHDRKCFKFESIPQKVFAEWTQSLLWR